MRTYGTLLNGTTAGRNRSAHLLAVSQRRCRPMEGIQSAREDATNLQDNSLSLHRLRVRQQMPARILAGSALR